MMKNGFNAAAGMMEISPKLDKDLGLFILHAKEKGGRELIRVEGRGRFQFRALGH